MSDDEVTGYGHPPKSTRFKKGVSGNPKGRPVGRRKRAPYEEVLGQSVKVRDAGQVKTLTAAQAFLLKLTNEALQGDMKSARLLHGALHKREELAQDVENSVNTIVLSAVVPGSVNRALEPLRMGSKLDRYRTTARMLLEPWIVEKALDRLGERTLSIEEQRIIVEATRTPNKVNWPEWWSVIPMA